MKRETVLEGETWPRLVVPVCLFLALAVILAEFFGGKLAVSALVAAVIFLCSVIRPPLGLIAFFFLLPYEEWDLGLGAVSVFLLWTPAFVAGVLLNTLSEGGKEKRIDIQMVFLLLFFLVVLFSSLYLFPGSRPDVRSVISISVLLFLTIFVVQIGRWYPATLKSLVTALLLGALVLAIVAFNSTENFRRLELQGAGGVRAVANYIALLAMLAFSLFSREVMMLRSGRKVFINFNRKMIFFGTVSFVSFALLFMTMSRGAILAILAGVLVTCSLAVFCSFKRAGLIVCSLMCALLIGLMVLPLLNYLTEGWLFRRLLRTFEGGEAGLGGVNVRAEVWGDVMSQLSFSQWLVGAGGGGFEALNAADLYAHSAYVSILVTSGLIGVAALLALVAVSLARSLRNGQYPYAFGFFAFLLVSFFTHGSVYSKYFWLSFAILLLISSNCRKPDFGSS